MRIDRPNLLLAALLAALVVLTYGPVLENGMVWDDAYLLANRAMRTPSEWGYFLQRPLDIWSDYYRPLVLISFAAQMWAFGTQVAHFHLGNVMIHAGTVVLVFAIGNRLLRLAGREDGLARWLSGVAAAIYAAHPVLIEPVAWISGRFDLAMAFFSTLAIWLVVGAHAAGRLSAVTLMGVFLATFAALLCKEHAVVLVVVLPGFWLACRSLPAWDPPGNAQRTVVVDAAKIFACACLALAVCLAMRYAALGTWVPKPQGFGIAAVDHLLVFLRTIGKITTLTIFPFTQVGPVHPLPRDLRSIDEFLTAGVLAIAIGTIGIAWLWRKQRALFWIAVAFVASLAPIAQIRQLPIGENYIQDRFLTQPLAIACIFLALALGHVKWTRQRGERGAALVSVLVCTFFFLASVANVQVTLPFWKTDDALWALARERAPNSPTVLNAVAGNLLGAGKVEEAYALSMRAMAAWPENQNIAITNAMIHAEKGELATARKILDYLYLRDDVNNRVRLNLADTLLRLGELQDAGYLLDEIATANPKDWNLAILRAELHFRNNEPERAHAHLREFFKGSPPVELDNALKKLKKRGVEID